MQSIKSRKEEAAQAQQAMMQGGQVQPMQQGAIVPQDVQQQISQNTNPIIQQMLAKDNAA